MHEEHEPNHWPALESCYVTGQLSDRHPVVVPHLQTIDEQEKRIDKDYQKYMKVQKTLFEDNPADYDTPAKLRKNLPLTRDNFISMNGGKAFWGGPAITERVKSFVQNDLPDFANEVYDAVIQTDWFIAKCDYEGRRDHRGRRAARRNYLKAFPQYSKTRLTSVRLGKKHLKRFSTSKKSQQHPFYKTPHRREPCKASIHELQKIFDASVKSFLQGMTPEEKEAAIGYAWDYRLVSKRDYVGEYSNRQQHNSAATSIYNKDWSPYDKKANKHKR